MFYILLNKAAFSTPKNYINAFKVRARLADFFKHIHPDQMVQAPTKIKDENLRSLKNFNSYLDAINQQKPIQGKLLKFYISEKTNHKSRKFFSFNLQLPQLNSQQIQLNEEKAGRLIDDIVNALNSKFKESRNMVDGKKKEKVVLEPQEIIETQAQKIKRKQETVGPFVNTRQEWTLDEQRLRSAINAKYMETQRQNLKLGLRKKMSFADTSTNKPMMWSRIIMNQGGIYNDYQKILKNLIDPKLIYFSEAIGIPQIEEFKKKMLPGQLDRWGLRATQAVLQVCQEMEQFSPPVSLFVTNHYSATQIPGFFSVPFNFQPVQMLEHWSKQKHTIIEQRSKYEQHFDYFQDLRKQLQKHNNFKVNQPAFKNNKDISQKLRVLQRLSKNTCPTMVEVHILQNDQFRILCHQYKLSETTVQVLQRKIFLTCQFQEEHLQIAIESIGIEIPKKVQQQL